jgi:hypothetical protein
MALSSIESSSNGYELFSPLSSDWMILPAMTNPRSIESSETAWTRTQIRELIALQIENNTGCLFTAAYMAKFALDHAWCGQEGHSYLEKMRTKFSKILYPNTMNPSHKYIDEWNGVYAHMGVTISSAILNNEALAVLDASKVNARKLKLNPKIINTWYTLSTEGTALPYGAWVIKGSKHTHIVTVDGSDESNGLIRDYRKGGFDLIGIFSYKLLPE